MAVESDGGLLYYNLTEKITAEAQRIQIATEALKH
jgi:hypothetical protein